jgi:hypothetical protein
VRAALARAAALCAALAAGVLLARCGQAILTAPAGSVLRVTANPPFIPAHGGVSVISAVVTEPAGTVVPDGTVVQFFTTLGRIDEQGRTNDGVARVNLTATALSGLAEVTAVSGGPGRPGGSPTSGPTASPSGRPSPSPSPARAPFASAQGSGRAAVTVAIGSELPSHIEVAADPVRLTTARAARLRAFVLDENGNPVANAPVFFRLRTLTGTESLDSRGDPVFTDNNGIAEDVLRTVALPTAPSRAVVVDATAANLTSGSVTVIVN